MSGSASKRVADQVAQRLVVAGRVDQVDLPPAGPQRAQGRAEAHLAVVLTAEGAGPAGDQHRAVVGEPLVEEVGGGRPGRPVVQPDVGHPATGRQVGDERDDRDAHLGQSLDRRDDQRVVRGLEDDALRAAPGDAVQGGHQLRDRWGLGEVEPRPERRRAHQRQLRLQRRPHRLREPSGRVDDQVQEERPPRQPHLGTLPVQVGDRAVDFIHGALPYAPALVEDPVDGGLGQSGLAGDLSDGIRVRHAASLRDK
jgi:hypothetical protein